MKPRSEKTVARRGGSKGSKPAKKTSGQSQNRRWSGQVMQRSDALDLQPNIFQSSNPRRIASSLKHSAEVSKRRKGTPYQSAMSMLNFYINRAGKNRPAQKKKTLVKAKGELRSQFGRT